MSMRAIVADITLRGTVQAHIINQSQCLSTHHKPTGTGLGSNPSLRWAMARPGTVDKADIVFKLSKESQAICNMCACSYSALYISQFPLHRKCNKYDMQTSTCFVLFLCRVKHLLWHVYVINFHRRTQRKYATCWKTRFKILPVTVGRAIQQFLAT